MTERWVKATARGLDIWINMARVNFIRVDGDGSTVDLDGREVSTLEPPDHFLQPFKKKGDK